VIAIVGLRVEARDTVEHVRFIRFEATTLICGDIDPHSIRCAFSSVAFLAQNRFRKNLCMGNAVLSESSINLEKFVRATRCSTVRQSNWNSALGRRIFKSHRRMTHDKASLIETRYAAAQGSYNECFCELCENLFPQSNSAFRRYCFNFESCCAIVVA
jgi:hypothetical protein